MMDHLSIMPAHIGSMSDSVMPGTLVGMVPNSPRYSAGALGLGSHISMWLGPPRIHRMMTDGFRLALLGADELARDSCRSRSARPSPAAPSTPALRKLRRSGRMVRLASAHPNRMPPWLLMRSLLQCGRVKRRMLR